MKRDEEIELLLQEWLEQKAQPMPRPVLESVLESVSRTAQVAIPRRRLGWFGNRPAGMLLAATLLVLIAVVGGLAVDRFGFLLREGSGAGGHVWDPVADWRSAPGEENPSRDSFGNPGVWSYLQSTSSSHNPASYALMPNFEGTDAWNQPGMDGTPDYLNEAWNEPALINAFVGLGVPDAGEAAIYLHPGVLTVLAWTSPVVGEATIGGVVARPQDPCLVPSGGLIFSVERGSQTLQTIGLDHGQRSDFNLSTVVGIGDTVYFVVDAHGDARCDLTSLHLTITVK